jgi:hypothetical protein
MRLITGLAIKGLRSIQSEHLQNMGELTALVGRNSSGKSNVLRALSLFFNGEIEPGKPLVLRRDHHNRPKQRRKRQITIAVDFELPANFKFRPEFKAAASALGGKFTIARSWGLTPQQTVTLTTQVLIDGEPIEKGEDHARGFLSLINYRYIPNRTVPAAMLRDESRLIASSIFAKMTGASGAEKLLESLDSAAGKLLKEAADSMLRSGAPLKEPAMSSPESLAEMLSVAGFQALGEHGEIVRDEEWGSGNQAFFLYEVLKAVDTNESRTFGWRRGTIWGVEEPESGLHRDLESRLADEFRQWTLSPSSKLQIIQTTHSPTFAMAATQGYWVELADGSSTIDPTPIPQLVRDAERRGVSAWVQPALAFPYNPVVLVEGQIDADVLTHVARVSGREQFRFLTLSEFDPAAKGHGKDNLGSYLKLHSALFPNRPSSAPLLVLVDWEVSANEMQNLRKAYGSGGEARVLQMNSAHCDPRLGQDFAGIERFYPVQIVLEASAAKEILIANQPPKPISISGAQLKAAKGALRKRVLAVQNVAQLSGLIKVLDDLTTAVRKI